MSFHKILTNIYTIKIKIITNIPYTAGVIRLENFL